MANDAGLEGVPDPDVLALAAQQGRVVVTSDLRTMPRHFGDFLDAHGHCPGVFLVKQTTPLAAVIEELVMVWAASDTEEWQDRIVEIPRVRFRDSERKIDRVPAVTFLPSHYLVMRTGRVLSVDSKPNSMGRARFPVS